MWPKVVYVVGRIHHKFMLISAPRYYQLINVSWISLGVSGKKRSFIVDKKLSLIGYFFKIYISYLISKWLSSPHDTKVRSFVYFQIMNQCSSCTDEKMKLNHHDGVLSGLKGATHHRLAIYFSRSTLVFFTIFFIHILFKKRP